MNRIKDFLLGNKNRVIMLAAIIVSIIVIIILAAVLSGKKGAGAEYPKETTKKATEKTTEKTTADTTEDSQELEITTLAEEETISLEEATVDEELGNISDDVSEEVQQKDSLPYLIKVNRAQNCITVYKKDETGGYTIPYKAIVCSTGKYVGDTPLGKFKTLRSYEWLLMVDGSYGQFAYRYYGSILFHSVPYFSKNKSDLEYEQFNKLGEPASLGCVRVCVRDAIWLIENCPVGTQVIVYDDNTSPGPLGKPEMIKIPEDSPNRGWDPTDPDPGNPWNNYGAKITVAETVSIAANKYSMDTIVKGIGATATDTCGNDITDKITASGSVNFNKPGSNVLVLTVKDAIGRTDTKTVKVVVEETETTAGSSTDTQPEKPSEQPSTTPVPPTTAKTVVLKMNSSSVRVLAGQYTDVKEIAKEIGCQAVYSDGTRVEDASGSVAVVSGSYNLNKEGSYTVQYRYTDGEGISSQDVAVTITVYTKPVILNVNTGNLQVTAGEYQKVTDIFSKMGMTAVDSRGRNMSNVASSVKYSGVLDINTPGSYSLTLTITDSYGVTSAGVSVTVVVKAPETESLVEIE